MNKGFEIYIQSDLTVEEKQIAIDFINKQFISKTCSDDKFRYFGKNGGGYTTGLWRGRLGITIKNDLIFRRISKNIRKFAVVKQNIMQVFNDKYLDKSHNIYRDICKNGEISNNYCSCPRHKGSIKVKFKELPKLDLYAKIGNPKG